MNEWMGLDIKYLQPTMKCSGVICVIKCCVNILVSGYLLCIADMQARERERESARVRVCVYIMHQPKLICEHDTVVCHP